MTKDVENEAGMKDGIKTKAKEGPPEAHLYGFPDWSQTISKNPEHLALIFKRFNDSSA